MKKALSGKRWFYAQGQRMRAQGLTLKKSYFYAIRNEMDYWAFRALGCGYEGIGLK